MSTGEPLRKAPDAGETPSRLGEIGLENFPPYLMNRIMGRYNAELRDALTASGLNTPKMRALAVLSVMDGLLIRDLAVYAVVIQSTLSRALDALERDGLVVRESDTADQRGTRIYLTQDGRATYERLWPHMAEMSAKMFQGIDDTEQRALVGTLQKMLRNIRKHDI